MLDLMLLMSGPTWLSSGSKSCFMVSNSIATIWLEGLAAVGEEIGETKVLAIAKWWNCERRGNDKGDAFARCGVANAEDVEEEGSIEGSDSSVEGVFP